MDRVGAVQTFPSSHSGSKTRHTGDEEEGGVCGLNVPSYKIRRVTLGMSKGRGGSELEIRQEDFPFRSTQWAAA